MLKVNYFSGLFSPNRITEFSKNMLNMFFQIKVCDKIPLCEIMQILQFQTLQENEEVEELMKGEVSYVSLSFLSML